MPLKHTEDIKIQKAKEDLAEQYVAEFKDELTGLKKMGISLVEKKMKELLLQDTELTDNKKDYNLTRWQETLASLSPTLTDKVINFLKEKQKLLLKVQTQQQLEALKQGIDPTTIPEEQESESNNAPQTPENNNNPEDNISPEESPDNVHIVNAENPMIGVGVLGSGMVGWAGQERRAHNKLGSRAEKLTNAISQKELKTSLQEIQKTLEAQTHNPKLLKFQKDNIKKTLKVFQEAEKNSNAVADLKLRKQLAKTNKVSGALFEKMSAKEIQALSKSLATVVDDTAFLEQIAKTSDPTAIKSLLQSKGITTMTDTMVESLARIDNVDDVASLTRVLSKGSEISSLAKAAKFLPLIDVAALGYDLYNWNHDNNQADAMRNAVRKDIAHNRANAHLAAGVANALLGASALLASGPPGWVAVAGVAVIEGGRVAADKLYYDVQDFYGQDEVDFATQEEIQVDQAILDAVAGGGRDNLSLNEGVCEFFGGIDKSKKMNTIQDALWAKIFLDEKDDFPLVYEYMQIQAYKANLESYTPEQQQSIHQQAKAFESKQTDYEAQRKNLDTIVATRMEYITPFLPGGNRFAEFTQNIKNSKGLAAINTIVAQSKTYLEMKADPNTQAQTVEAYLTEKETALQQENPHIFGELKKIADNNPQQYDEIIHHTRAFSMIDEGTYRAENTTLFTTADYLIRWDDWYQANHPHNRTTLTIENDYSGIEKTLTDLSQGKSLQFTVTPFTQEELSFGLDSISNNSQEQYADGLGHNVLYRFLREFCHYTGHNDMIEMQQFAEDDGGEARNDARGIYYDPAEKQWFINDDNARDWPVNLHDMETMTPEERGKKYFFGNPGTGKKAIIDGDTETIDAEKTDEFINTFIRIIGEEKAQRTPEHQKKVSDEIVSYIKNNAQTNGYILLPHHLIAAGVRAGLGEMQYWFFSLDAQGKILAVTDAAHISSPLRLENVAKQYNSTNGNIQSLHNSQEKQQAISQIDTMIQEISKTMGELQLSERGKISYNPETGELSSWGTTITCLYDTKKKTRNLGDAFPIVYKNMKDALWIANLTNRIRAYKKEHGDAVFQRGYMGVKDGLYNTATTPDTQILDPDTIDSHYAASFSKKWRETMIDYYNNLPAKVDKAISENV